MTKLPNEKEFKEAKNLYRKLRLKISFPKKRWIMDAASFEDYLARMKNLAKKYGVKDF